MLDIFLSPPREALPLLESLGVAYVTFCPGSPERYTYAAVAPDGLAAALSRGAIPDGSSAFRLTESISRSTGQGGDLIIRIGCGIDFAGGGDHFYKWVENNDS